MSAYRFMPAESVYELDLCLDCLGCCLMDMDVDPETDTGR